jgi:hypothetical protein
LETIQKSDGGEIMERRHPISRRPIRKKKKKKKKKMKKKFRGRWPNEEGNAAASKVES